MLTDVLASGFGQKGRVEATYVTPDIMYCLGFYDFRQHFEKYTTFFF